MRRSKTNELLLSPGEWATIGAAHETTSLEFEALSQAVADVLSGRARSLHVALRSAAEGTGAEQVSRATHNWAVHEVRDVGIAAAERIAADPIAVIQGVLFELAALHHEAHKTCTLEALARWRGGRPKGVAGTEAHEPDKPLKRLGRKPGLDMTDEMLRAWAIQRAVGQKPATGLTDGLRQLAKRRLSERGKQSASDQTIEGFAQSWATRLRRMKRQQGA